MVLETHPCELMELQLLRFNQSHQHGIPTGGGLRGLLLQTSRSVWGLEDCARDQVFAFVSVTVFVFVSVFVFVFVFVITI